MKRIVVSPFGSVRSRINPGSTVTSNERLQNRQMRDFFQSFRQAIAVPGIFFAHVAGFGFPLKLPGLIGFRSFAVTCWRSPRLALNGI
jgi:hypothetical protein